MAEEKLTYNKTEWEDWPSRKTKITSKSLMNIENMIEKLCKTVNNHTTQINNQATKITNMGTIGKGQVYIYQGKKLIASINVNQSHNQNIFLDSGSSSEQETGTWKPTLYWIFCTDTTFQMLPCETSQSEGSYWFDGEVIHCDGHVQLIASVPEIYRTDDYYLGIRVPVTPKGPATGMAHVFGFSDAKLITGQQFIINTNLCMRNFELGLTYITLNLTYQK